MNRTVVKIFHESPRLAGWQDVHPDLIQDLAEASNSLCHVKCTVVESTSVADN